MRKIVVQCKLLQAGTYTSWSRQWSHSCPWACIPWTQLVGGSSMLGSTRTWWLYCRISPLATSPWKENSPCFRYCGDLKRWAGEEQNVGGQRTSANVNLRRRLIFWRVECRVVVDADVKVMLGRVGGVASPFMYQFFSTKVRDTAALAGLTAALAGFNSDSECRCNRSAATLLRRT